MAASDLTAQPRLTKNGKRVGRPPRVGPRPPLTQELLRELFRYDPETGDLVSIKWRGPHTNVGMPAGHPNKKGHLNVSVLGGRYLVHRLIWLYAYGQWPTQQIDHINGNPADNRISNLRDVPQSINQHNQPNPQRNSTTGARGVYANYKSNTSGQRYQVLVSTNGKKHHVGMFGSIEEASKAYVDAKKRLHAGYVER